MKLSKQGQAALDEITQMIQLLREEVQRVGLAETFKRAELLGYTPGQLRDVLDRLNIREMPLRDFREFIEELTPRQWIARTTDGRLILVDEQNLEYIFFTIERLKN
jgi:hypothetical protein